MSEVAESRAISRVLALLAGLGFAAVGLAGEPPGAPPAPPARATRLLHDIDLAATRASPSQHGVVGARLVLELGFGAAVAQAVAAHDDVASVPRRAPMDHALYCADRAFWAIRSSGVDLEGGTGPTTPGAVVEGLARKGITNRIDKRLSEACAALGLTLDELLSASLAAMRRVPSADGTGAFATGKYRNLFVEAGHTEAETDAKIARAWKQLFEGDPETERLFTPSGRNENGPLAYIPDIQHADVRSEGMSYGMIIAVQLDRKAEFDALWNWSMTYMYQKDPKHPSYGFFSWQMAYDGSVMDELPAPDGEEYYAMALYFAAHRWGAGKGLYDYATHADRLLRDMVHRQPITGMVRQRGGLRQHTVGKEVNDEHGMILFSPDERNGMTDASYHLPAFYELWARWGPEEDRAFWARAAAVSRDYLAKAAHPKTGLVPNFGQFDGTPWGFRGLESAEFREDAWRVAMNGSVDWAWWAKDPRQRELSDRLQGFFESQGIATYGDNWKLDGTLTRDRHSPGLVATNGVASLAATDGARARKFTEALWNLDVPSSTVFRYYDGLLYLMSLLHASGRFQVIEPKR